MITLHSLKPSTARHQIKRVGRGNSSGKGTTAGRGTKGQRARTGGRNKAIRRSLRALIERTPKVRGFRSRRINLTTVTLADIAQRFTSDQVVTPTRLAAAGLINRPQEKVKVVGQVTTAKKLTIKVNKFSVGAKSSIEKNGGHAVIIDQKG
jgi:large subunit ribosomal protein L15